MKVNKTFITNLLVLEPNIFEDKRGYFFESYNKKTFKKNIGDFSFIQDNESKSSRGVLRGLHFQKPPFEQTKLVRCIKGEILDVAVDIRKNSNTYGKYYSLILSEKNKKQILIPKGFAHGFVVLSESAIINYKVDNFYNQKCDSGIIWNDPILNIDWNFDSNKVLISDKDKNLPFFKNLN